MARLVANGNYILEREHSERIKVHNLRNNSVQWKAGQIMARANVIGPTL